MYTVNCSPKHNLAIGELCRDMARVTFPKGQFS